MDINTTKLKAIKEKLGIRYGAQDLAIKMRIQAMDWENCKREIENAKRKLLLSKLFIALEAAIENTHNDPIYISRKTLENWGISKVGFFKFAPLTEDREKYINECIDFLESKINPQNSFTNFINYALSLF